MTRINFEIEPKYLCDQHLLAEIRELPRISSVLAKRIAKHFLLKPKPEEPSYDFTQRIFREYTVQVEMGLPPAVVKLDVANDIPANFTLGSGSVSFFLDKGRYLHERYTTLTEEAIRRNIRRWSNKETYQTHPLGFYNTPTELQRANFREHEQANLVARIYERAPSKGPRYYREYDQAQFDLRFMPRGKGE